MKSFTLAMLLTASALAQPPGIVTKSYDNARSGMWPHESILTQASVAQKGLVLERVIPVYGDARGMEAQPLIWSGVMVLPSMANIIRGVRPDDGAGIWQTGQLCVPVDSTPENDMWRINQHFGMMSTGVIDSDTSKLYQVATCSKDNSGAQASMEQRMFVLDVRTGTVLASTVLEGASNGLRYSDIPRKQRGALALWKRNGVKMVMIEAGSFSETGSKAGGWLLAFDTYDNQVKAAISTRAGLWGSGIGPAIDDATGFIYVGAGNGPFNNVDAFGEAAMQIQFTPPTATTAASFTKLHAWAMFSDSSRTCANPQLTQPRAMPGRIAGAAMPMGPPCDPSWGDQDAWLTGTLLTKFHLYLGAGKDGVAVALDTLHFPDTMPADFADPKKNCAKVKLYELGWDLGVDPCPANMTKLNLPGKTRHIHSPIIQVEQHGVTYLLVFAENSPLQAWRIAEDGTFHFVARGTEMASAGVPSGMPGGFGTGSSGPNGENAIAWYSIPVGDANRTVTTGYLAAYDLSNLAALEGTGKMIPTIWRSDPYTFSKFSTPTIWNGKVILANYAGSVLEFGLGK